MANYKVDLPISDFFGLFKKGFPGKIPIFQPLLPFTTLQYKSRLMEDKYSKNSTIPVHITSKSIAIKRNKYTRDHETTLTMQVSTPMRSLLSDPHVQGAQGVSLLSAWQPLVTQEPWPRNGVRTPPPDAEIRKICEQFYLTSDSDESQTQSRVLVCENKISRL